MYCLILLFSIVIVMMLGRLIVGKADWRAIFVITFTLYLLVAFYVYLPYRWKKLYHQQQLLHDRFRCDFTQDAMITEGVFGNSSIPWEMFHKWKEGKKLFLIYQADNLFHVIPKRVLENEEEHLLRNRLLQSIGKPMT